MNHAGNTRNTVSSQAGLAALRGPNNSYPSIPPPGQPGSRFTPVVPEVRDDMPNTMDVARDLIDSLAVGIVRSAPAKIPDQVKAPEPERQMPQRQNEDEGLGF